MTLTITYQNGKTLEQRVNYVHTEDGKLYYTMDKKVYSLGEPPVIIPLANIKTFEVNPNE